MVLSPDWVHGPGSQSDVWLGWITFSLTDRCYPAAITAFADTFCSKPGSVTSPNIGEVLCCRDGEGGAGWLIVRLGRTIRQSTGQILELRIGAHAAAEYVDQKPRV